MLTVQVRLREAGSNNVSNILQKNKSTFCVLCVHFNLAMHAIQHGLVSALTFKCSQYK